MQSPFSFCQVFQLRFANARRAIYEINAENGGLSFFLQVGEVSPHEALMHIARTL